MWHVVACGYKVIFFSVVVKLISCIEEHTEDIKGSIVARINVRLLTVKTGVLKQHTKTVFSFSACACYSIIFVHAII